MFDAAWDSFVVQACTAKAASDLLAKSTVHHMASHPEEAVAEFIRKKQWTLHVTIDTLLQAMFDASSQTLAEHHSVLAAEWEQYRTALRHHHYSQHFAPYEPYHTPGVYTRDVFRHVTLHNLNDNPLWNTLFGANKPQTPHLKAVRSSLLLYPRGAPIQASQAGVDNSQTVAQLQTLQRVVAEERARMRAEHASRTNKLREAQTRFEEGADALHSDQLVQQIQSFQRDTQYLAANGDADPTFAYWNRRTLFHAGKKLWSLLGMFMQRNQDISVLDTLAPSPRQTHDWKAALADLKQVVLDDVAQERDNLDRIDTATHKRMLFREFLRLTQKKALDMLAVLSHSIEEACNRFKNVPLARTLTAALKELLAQIEEDKDALKRLVPESTDEENAYQVAIAEKRERLAVRESIQMAKRAYNEMAQVGEHEPNRVRKMCVRLYRFIEGMAQGDGSDLRKDIEHDRVLLQGLELANTGIPGLSKERITFHAWSDFYLATLTDDLGEVMRDTRKDIQADHLLGVPSPRLLLALHSEWPVDSASWLQFRPYVAAAYTQAVESNKHQVSAGTLSAFVKTPLLSQQPLPTMRSILDGMFVLLQTTFV